MMAGVKLGRRRRVLSAAALLLRATPGRVGFRQVPYCCHGPAHRMAWAQKPLSALVAALSLHVVAVIEPPPRPPRLPVSAVVALDPAAGPPPGPEDTLRVAAVQTCNFDDGTLRSATQEIADKTTKVVDYIQRAAAQGAEIAVFPEMVLTRYDAALIANGTAAEIGAAEARIATACRASKIWAIVGLPKYMPAGAAPTEATCNADARWWNTALVFNDRGEKVYRQAKLRCGGPDGQLGRWLDTWQGPKNVTSSLQICADAGDPNIARLPALQGARVIYDISAESGLDSFTKLAPYEAQYMARAHESHSFLVQANVGATKSRAGGSGGGGGLGWQLDAQGGSHGNSLVIAPVRRQSAFLLFLSFWEERHFLSFL